MRLPPGGLFAPGFADFGLTVYIRTGPRKLIKLSPGVARRFVKDMRVYFAGTNLIKRDEIVARQLHALREQYATGSSSG